MRICIPEEGCAGPRGNQTAIQAAGLEPRGVTTYSGLGPCVLSCTCRSCRRAVCLLHPHAASSANLISSKPTQNLLQQGTGR